MARLEKQCAARGAAGAALQLQVASCVPTPSPAAPCRSTCVDVGVGGLEVVHKPLVLLHGSSGGAVQRCGGCLWQGPAARRSHSPQKLSGGLARAVALPSRPTQRHVEQPCASTPRSPRCRSAPRCAPASQPVGRDSPQQRLAAWACCINAPPHGAAPGLLDMPSTTDRTPAAAVKAAALAQQRRRQQQPAVPTMSLCSTSGDRMWWHTPALPLVISSAKYWVARLIICRRAAM